MAVIALLSLATFVLPLDDSAVEESMDLASTVMPVNGELLHARLDLSMTILLTAVAFKFITISFLPQISYLTLIDKFVLMFSRLV